MLRLMYFLGLLPGNDNKKNPISGMWKVNPAIITVKSIIFMCENKLLYYLRRKFLLQKITVVINNHG